MGHWCLRAQSLDGSYHSARTPSIISVSGSNYLRAGGFRHESPPQASRLHSLVSMDTVTEWIQVGLNARRSSRTKRLKPELEPGLDFSFPPSSTPAKDNTSEFRLQARKLPYVVRSPGRSRHFFRLLQCLIFLFSFGGGVGEGWLFLFSLF